MSINKDFEDLLLHLNSAKAKYIIVGAYAVIYYTEPRYTKDIDVWIQPEPKNALKVFEALKNFGAPLHELTPEDLCNKELVYQVGIEPNRIDILMDIQGVNFEKAWKNKKRHSFGDQKVYILSLEDLKKTKKKTNRPQDRIDLEKLIQISKK